MPGIRNYMAELLTITNAMNYSAPISLDAAVAPWMQDWKMVKPKQSNQMVLLGDVLLRLPIQECCLMARKQYLRFSRTLPTVKTGKRNCWLQKKKRRLVTD